MVVCCSCKDSVVAGEVIELGEDVVICGFCFGLFVERFEEPYMRGVVDCLCLALPKDVGRTLRLRVVTAIMQQRKRFSSMLQTPTSGFLRSTGS